MNEINQTNQTNLLRLGSPTRNAIWKVQGYGLVLITFLSFFPVLFHLEEYIFFALLLVALGAAWLDGKAIWIRTPIDLPLLLLVGWVLLTIPFAIDPAYSFGEWRKLVTQILVFYFALLVLRSNGDGTTPQRLLAGVFIATAVISAYGLYDFLDRDGTWKDRALVQARAPGSDPNWLSTYLVIAIPFAISAGVAIRGRWKRSAWVILLALGLTAQFSSYVRAGWLAHFAQGVAFGLFTGRKRVAIYFVGGAFLFAGLLLAVSDMGHQKATTHPISVYARLAAWKLGAGDVSKHPLVGVGYGNDTFAKLYGERVQTQEKEVAVGLHNTFLMVAMGSGVPALIFLGWAFVSAFRSLIFSIRKVSAARPYTLMIGTAIMIVGFAVRNFFDYMFAGSLAYLFWILMAVGMAEVIKARAVPQLDRHTAGP